MQTIFDDLLEILTYVVVWY